MLFLSLNPIVSIAAVNSNYVEIDKKVDKAMRIVISYFVCHSTDNIVILTCYWWKTLSASSLNVSRMFCCWFTCSYLGWICVGIAEEPSNGFSVICHGNGLMANGMSKHVASATVDAKLDIHKTPPPSKRLWCYMLFFFTLDCISF